MTLLDVPPPSARAARPRRAGKWIAGVAVALTLAVGGLLVIAIWSYDDIPVPNVLRPQHAIVELRELPAPVQHAFVAAVDPDFYDSETSVMPSLIIRRYVMAAANDGDTDVSSWRAFVMASKLEAQYTREEILGFYLNVADYGRGAEGLVEAAQTYFGKPPTRLTVAEAALLAVQLDPDKPETQAGWDQVLDTMVDNGWLTAAERDGLTFPR
jgi:membrane peptidoglycan carboxypeptidase